MISFLYKTTDTAQQRALGTATAVFGLLMVLAAPANGQVVRGQVVDSLTQTPIDGGQVLLIDAGGTEVARTLTDPEGLFLMRAAAAGEYRVRVETAGYRASEFPPFNLAADQMRGFMLLVSPLMAPQIAEDDAELIVERACTGGVPAGLPVIIGLVRRAGSLEPVANAEVHMSWSPVPTVLSQHVALDHSEGVAVTGSTGFYGICGAPVGTRVFLHAEHEGRMSELMALTFDNGGVLRGSSFDSLTSRVLRVDFDLLPPTAHSATITGTVTDTSGTPVADATVTVVGTRLTARANFLGSFEIRNVPAGVVALKADRIGYRPSQGEITVFTGDNVALRRDFFRLVEIPPVLAPIAIEAEAPETRRDLSEFFKRRESSSGSFITREEFERQGNVRTTVDLLSRMRGIYVRTGFGNLEYLVTTRRGMGRTGLRSGTAGNCYPLVYVDRLYVGTTADFNINQTIVIDDIEAAEVHSSAASLPPEFNRPGATCGVIVFWTR